MTHYVVQFALTLVILVNAASGAAGAIGRRQSQGLLDQTNKDDLAPVLAHERAHAARRDPLRRLIASAGLVLHLPGIAHLLDRLLTRTQEMAADADAARTVGDRV